MRTAPLPPITSGLNESAKLESFVLDLLALKLCKTEEDLQLALRKSIFEGEAPNWLTLVKESLETLKSRQMITVSQSRRMRSLGRPTLRSPSWDWRLRAAISSPAQAHSSTTSWFVLWTKVRCFFAYYAV